MRTYRRVLGLMSAHRRWIAAGIALSALAIGANIALMATSAYLISRAAFLTNVADVALAITAVRVLAIARAALRYGERYATHLATFRILADLRTWFYRSIEPLAPARLVTYRSGDLLTRIVADIDTLEDVYVRVIVPPMVAIAVAAAGAALLGLVDVRLGVILALAMAIAGFGIPALARRTTRRPSRELIDLRARSATMLVDEIQGVAELVAFDGARRHRADLLDLGRRADRLDRRIATRRAVADASIATAAALTGIAILAVAVPLVSAGALDAVILAALPLAAVATFEAVQPLAASFRLVDGTTAAADRLFELTDAEPEVTDPPPTAVAPAPARTTFDIRIRGLHFQYDPALPEVLAGLDLDVPAGSSLAILGASGAGKTTLVDLLLRFRDYDHGEIRIGGHDLHKYRAADVRAWIGVVSQRVHLFDTTIRDNLAVADPDVTDERIADACRQARLDGFIAGLPDGYGTRIGEDGVRLSGGERQRLAIARAIIKDAPILILDEATANLDVETEASVMDGIAAFAATRTVIVITHRAAVAARCDATVRLERGRIVGDGAATPVAVAVPSASPGRSSARRPTTDEAYPAR